jgi:hypothetical protein
MPQSEEQKMRRRVRERLARLNLSLGYVRKLVKEKWERRGIPIASEDITIALLQAEQVVLAVKRACWGRPAILPEWIDKK